MVGQLTLRVITPDAIVLDEQASYVRIPGADGFGAIVQGFLELSNVNAVQEVTNLITAQRAYEMNSRVITTADEMMRTMASLR